MGVLDIVHPTSNTPLKITKGSSIRYLVRLHDSHQYQIHDTTVLVQCTRLLRSSSAILSTIIKWFWTFIHPLWTSYFHLTSKWFHIGSPLYSSSFFIIIEWFPIGSPLQILYVEPSKRHLSTWQLEVQRTRPTPPLMLASNISLHSECLAFLPLTIR